MKIKKTSASGLKKLLIALGVVWGIGAMFFAIGRQARTTPETVIAYFSAQQLPQEGTPERKEWLAGAIERVNRLNFDERQEVRKSKADIGFFHKLTAEEKNEFIFKTLPDGFKHSIQALNGMEPERRKKILKDVMERLDQNELDHNEAVIEESFEKIVAIGVESFFENASAEVKIEFAPALEQLQRRLRR